MCLTFMHHELFRDALILTDGVTTFNKSLMMDLRPLSPVLYLFLVFVL
jgi:hypothetical protein